MTERRPTYGNEQPPSLDWTALPDGLTARQFDILKEQANIALLALWAGGITRGELAAVFRVVAQMIEGKAQPEDGYHVVIADNSLFIHEHVNGQIVQSHAIPLDEVEGLEAWLRQWQAEMAEGDHEPR